MVCYFFSYFGVSINCRSWVCKLHNIILTCAETHCIVIYESSVPTNWYFLVFCLFCKFFKSDLEIINLIFDIFRHVDSTYITEYLMLSCIEKITLNCWPFFAYFLLINKLYELNVVLFHLFKLCNIF